MFRYKLTLSFETPQVENNPSNDYKQFKSQEAKQQDLHCMHAHASMHTNTYTHTHTCMHTRTHAHTHARTHTPTHTQMLAHTHSFMFAHLKYFRNKLEAD